MTTEEFRHCHRIRVHDCVILSMSTRTHHRNHRHLCLQIVSKKVKVNPWGIKLSTACKVNWTETDLFGLTFT